VDADHVPSEITEILISDEQLQQRLAEVAAQVDADYAGRALLLVGRTWTGWRSPPTAPGRPPVASYAS